MERLTQPDFNICDNCTSGTTCEHFCDPAFPPCEEKAVYDRLIAYEDSGMEPEEIMELVQAKKVGRLVEQKAIPGTEVWVVNRDEYGEAYDASGYMFLAEVSGFVILTAYINDLEGLTDTMAYHADETSMNYDTNLVVYPAADCYLTREEAEAALDAQEGDEGK